MRPAAVSALAPLGVDPFKDFGEGPDDAARGQVEPLWEFALLFEFVDCRVRQRHELAEFRPPDRSAPEDIGGGNPLWIG